VLSEPAPSWACPPPLCTTRGDRRDSRRGHQRLVRRRSRQRLHWRGHQRTTAAVRVEGCGAGVDGVTRNRHARHTRGGRMAIARSTGRAKQKTWRRWLPWWRPDRRHGVPRRRRDPGVDAPGAGHHRAEELRPAAQTARRRQIGHVHRTRNEERAASPEMPDRVVDTHLRRVAV
jgi:hypothetical protein